MLEDLLNEIEELTKPQKPYLDYMPERPTMDLKQLADTNTPAGQTKPLNNPCSGLSTYSIEKNTRTLTINNQNFYIDDFFDLENFKRGDYRTVDYILTYKGFNINNFDVIAIEE